MNRKIVPTADGSSTIYDPISGDHYHSLHGAENESRHVFIKKGLTDFLNSNESKNVHLLEVGFGTGLNAIITYQEMMGHQDRRLVYHTLEPNPVTQTEISELKFESIKQLENEAIFQRMHEGDWSSIIALSENMSFVKYKKDLQKFESDVLYDIVYYDAFAPSHQAEMWSVSIFNRIAQLMRTNGILVSYCAQGQFRRNLIESGFEVEKLEGPPGKREMIRATKV